ncbi:hypothetical protein P152DRAFT_462052 [Eremomyces bilateralis CBS 781.70]|uniref:Uncharacterized protein n=1 Tax=Eremomyces bilateralis CBS 781.70 TaxID=1392243 RepID=A0A6G1FSX9_9PEZI|nr:uncharacterized protein P152DRAFT_462052 [Eremomyces bilateralis CBS 781.70]KAF1808818.1 hypothetical protein P152DRAFT_462052 [Eremomyces bilateralis CBS 781.70]
MAPTTARGSNLSQRPVHVDISMQPTPSGEEWWIGDLTTTFREKRRIVVIAGADISTAAEV